MLSGGTIVNFLFALRTSRRTAGRDHHYTGSNIEASAQQSGEVIMVRFKARSPFANLSSREMQAATLFSAAPIQQHTETASLETYGRLA
jgi:hypothetical protein